MKHNFEDENDNGPWDPRYPGRKVVADGGRVRVHMMLADADQHERHSRADTRSEAVRLRDESHALMVDRMRNPKSFDPLTGRRLVRDGLAEDLSPEDLYALAQRLAPVLAIGMPKFAPDHPDEADEDNGMERQGRDNRRPHYKPVRDQAMATKLRDEAYAEMVDRMRNPKSYDHNGRRI